MSSDNCQNCGSRRIARVFAKCDDRCAYELGDYDNVGYAPYDVGIGGGDLIEFAYCLDCGQMQGTWPVGDPDDGE